jgi:hypothetical protein
MSNASLRTADRATHVKIVVVSLVASIAVIVVGLLARTESGDTATARLQSNPPVVKAGGPVIVTRSDATAVR